MLLCAKLSLDTIKWAMHAPLATLHLNYPLIAVEDISMDLDSHNDYILSRTRSFGDPDLDMASWRKHLASLLQNR